MFLAIGVASVETSCVWTMSAPLPRLFPISSTWDQTLIEEEERWDPGNILAYSKYPKQLHNILGDNNLVSTWSLTWNISIIQYFFLLIHLIARVRRKKILILMSCLVLEGNMILISGVSGASPTSLLSVNFLFGSWPDNEFTLPGETSAVSWQYPDLLKSMQGDRKISRAIQKYPEWPGVYTA